MNKLKTAERQSENRGQRSCIGLASCSALSFDVEITSADRPVRHAPQPRLTPDSVLLVGRKAHPSGSAARPTRRGNGLATTRHCGEAEQPKPTPQASGHPYHTKLNMNTNILIYSKDPVIRQAAADAVAEGGFEVALAHDGYEALDQLGLGAIELVVLDLDYKGKDAWDLVESLLETHPLTPIVFLTSARAGAEWGLFTAVGEMLEKPLPAARLVAGVRRLLAEGTAQRLNRNSSQRMAVRYSRPYVGSPSTAPAYSGWGINE